MPVTFPPSLRNQVFPVSKGAVGAGKALSKGLPKHRTKYSSSPSCTGTAGVYELTGRNYNSSFRGSSHHVYACRRRWQNLSVLVLLHGAMSFIYPHDPDQGHHEGSGVSFSSFNVNSPLEVIAGRVHLRRFYTVCSIYLLPNTPVKRVEVNSLFRHLFPSLVLGNFSGRHPL